MFEKKEPDTEKIKNEKDNAERVKQTAAGMILGLVFDYCRKHADKITKTLKHLFIK